MSKIVIKFPPNNDGEEQGLNDAGVETFGGKTGHYVAREGAQNVGDAAAPGVETVLIAFDLIDLPTASIPCATDLANVFKASREFWRTNKKTQDFCDTALKNLSKPKIPVLKISDYGTTGLTGADSDRQGKWYCLVRSGGVSNKEGGTGGSYGIGKFAPFAASALRTVIYSTRTQDGSVAFQGVSRLVTHMDGNAATTQGTGYIGIYDEHRFKAVRETGEIPEVFRRTEPGTDIFVLGYNDPVEWQKHLMFSILKNFWPAIHERKIAFQVDGMRIDHETLGTKLKEFSDQADFDAHLYYDSLTAEGRLTFDTEIENLGKVRLHLIAGTEDYPKRVALTRRTGMVIDWKRFNSRKPFCGYLVCDDEQGNQLLRSLEPPRHDTWDPDRGGRKEKKALNELYGWIRERIKELNPASTAATLDVPDLARFLPDMGDEEEDKEAAEDKKAENGFISKPTPPPVPIRTFPSSPIRPMAFKEGGGNDASNGGGGGGGGGGGSGGGGEDGEGRSLKKATERKPKLAIRSYIDRMNRYQIVIRTDLNYTGSVCLVAVGENGDQEQPAIREATLGDGQKLEIRGRAVIRDVTLSVEHPTKLMVVLANRTKLALNAIPV